jgi:hypothetical protein
MEAKADQLNVVDPIIVAPSGEVPPLSKLRIVTYQAAPSRRKATIAARTRRF